MSDSKRKNSWLVKAYSKAKLKSARSTSVPYFATGDGVMVVKAEDILSSKMVLDQLQDIKEIEHKYKIRKAKKIVKDVVHEVALHAEG